MKKGPKLTETSRQLVADAGRWDLETATGLVKELLERAENLQKENELLRIKTQEVKKAKKTDRDDEEWRYRQARAAEQRELGLESRVDELRRQNFALRAVLLKIRDYPDTDGWHRSSAVSEMRVIASEALKEKDIYT